MFNKRIYLDYASLTPIDPRVLREMKVFSAPKYANPASLYHEGVFAKKALAQARKQVADFIGAHSDEIIFTSGGTEANNMALQGVVRSAWMNGIKNPHVIISAIEHSSIIEVVKMMEKNGCEVTILNVDHSGIVSLDELKKAIKPNTVIISIMTVNNEIGSIQPIRDIAKVVRTARKDFQGGRQGGRTSDMYPLLHTDSAQAVLYQDLNVEKLGVDLLTLDGSKVYGPRGIGCLYIKRNTPIQPIIHGGGQEFGMRSGTENIPAIMGFAKALEIAKIENKKDQNNKKIIAFRSMMIAGLRKIRPDIVINGNENTDARMNTVQSPHILNISIPGIDNEFFIFQLDTKGVACSTKSSCLHDEDESYVLKAIGADTKTSVRFSFGRWTKKGDVVKVLKVISRILKI